MAHQEVGKWLLGAALVIGAIGLYLRSGLPVPPIGRLPGDIVIRREGWTIYIPIASMILASLLLTLLVRLLGRR